MKTLLALFFSCFACVVLGQAPPIQRNDFTTNTAGYGIISNAVNGVSSGSSSLNLTLENWQKSLLTGSNNSILAFGDSTAYYVPGNILLQSYHHLGSNGFRHPMTSGLNYHTAGAITNVSGTGSTNWFATQFDIGTNAVNGPGLLCTSNLLGMDGCIWSDTFSLDAQISPLGGSLIWRVRTNGGTVVLIKTIDTVAAYRGLATNMTLLPGWYRTEVVYSNAATTRVFGLGIWNSTDPGLRVTGFGQAGGNLGDIVNVATNVSGPILLAINPKIVFWEALDSSNHVATNITAFRTLLTNFCKDADIVLVGATPILSGDDEIVAQNGVTRQFALTNKFGYLDTRGMRYMQTYQMMTNEYGASDGTHAPSSAQVAMGGEFIYQSSLLHNGAIAAQFVNGTPPPGRGYIAQSASTNYLTGDLGTAGRGYYGTGLQVDSELKVAGAGGIVSIANRNAPTDAARLAQLYNNDAAGVNMLFRFGNNDIAEMNVNAGSPYLAPSTTYSPFSSIGQPAAPYNRGYIANLTASNYIILGANTNTMIVVSNTSTTGPGVLYVLRSTNGVFGAPVLSMNLTNGNVGIGTNAPGRPLDIAGTMVAGAGTAAQPSYSFNGDTNTGFYNPSDDQIGVSIGGVIGIDFVASTLTRMLNTHVWAWSSGSPFSTTADTSFYRSAAGIVGIGVGGSAPAGSLDLSNATHRGWTAYKSNALTAAQVLGSITNGDHVIVTLSNSLQMGWWSNNVAFWKVLGP